MSKIFHILLLSLIHIFAASMEEVSASLYDLAQGCNNLLENMAGMNEDAKNSAMKLQEVKLTAERCV